MNDEDWSYSNRIPNWQPLAGRMASMLRRLEWSNGETGGYGCPLCKAMNARLDDKTRPGFGAHYPDCDLATLLRDLP